MARENVTNFATTTLLNPMGASDSSFQVAASGGTNFPTVSSTNPQYFLVAIDSEIILCSARAGDVFTVVTRGYEGTGASSHTAGATVIHAPTAGMLTHLWSNVAEGWNADVPPYARNGPAPDSYNDEFETQNSAWQIYPTPSGGDIIDFNVVKSCLRFKRADFSNTNYHVYKPFAPGSGVPFMVMCKLSHGAREWGQSPNGSPIPLEAAFFVSDQNPLTSADSGNLARVDHNISGFQIQIQNSNGSNGPVARVEMLKSTQVVNSRLTVLDWVIGNGNLYYKMLYTGGGYLYYVGDGYVWRCIGQGQGGPSTPASIGFRFLVNGGTSSRTEQAVVIDWLRCYIGTSEEGAMMTDY